MFFFTTIYMIQKTCEPQWLSASLHSAFLTFNTLLRDDARDVRRQHTAPFKMQSNKQLLNKTIFYNHLQRNGLGYFNKLNLGEQ